VAATQFSRYLALFNYSDLFYPEENLTKCDKETTSNQRFTPPEEKSGQQIARHFVLL